MKKLCIVAGDYKQATDYANYRKFSPNDWFYASIGNMPGMRNYCYALVGTYTENPNIDHILTELMIADAKHI